MSQVIGHELDAAASFQEVDGDGVPEGMNGAARDAGFLGVAGEQVLDVAFLEGTFSTREQVRAMVSTRDALV
jgi:hypothetical protein